LLLKAGQDPDHSLQVQVIDTLVQMGERVREPLLQALQADDWQVWGMAAEALGRLGVPALDPLL